MRSRGGMTAVPVSDCLECVDGLDMVLTGKYLISMLLTSNTSRAVRPEATEE